MPYLGGLSAEAVAVEGPAPPSWSPQGPDQASQLVSPSHAVASAPERTRQGPRMNKLGREEGPQSHSFCL